MSAAESGSGIRRGWSTRLSELQRGPGPTGRDFGDGQKSPRFRKGPSETSKALFDRDAEQFGAQAAAAGKRGPALSQRLRLGRSNRPTHFETGSGFNIAGAQGAQAMLGRLATAVRDYVSSWWRVEPVGSGHLAAPAPLLIEFDNGNWGGAAALPNHMATFTIEGRRSSVSSIGRFLRFRSSLRETELAVAQLRAGVLSAQAGYDLAARLRDQKARDPVRGVIAAYIYDALGDRDSVRRIAWYLAAAGVPVPYDVALLGHLAATKSGGGPVKAEIPETPRRTARSPEETNRQWTFDATPPARAPVAGAFPGCGKAGCCSKTKTLGPCHRWPCAAEGRTVGSPFTTLTARGGRRLKTMIEEA